MPETEPESAQAAQAVVASASAGASAAQEPAWLRVWRELTTGSLAAAGAGEGGAEECEADRADAVPAWRDRLWWLLLGLACILVTALRLHGLREVLDPDEAFYALVARAWSLGDRLYVDLWDNKPIGTFLIYRLGGWLFGYTELMPRLISLGATLLTTVGLAWLLRVYRRPVQILVLLGIWPALSCLATAEAQGANMEVFLLPFLVLAIAAVQYRAATGREGGFYLALVVIGLSLLVKQVTLPFLAVPFAMLPPDAWRRWRGMLLRAVALLVVLLGGHLLLYGAFGYGPTFLVDQLQGNAQYVAASSQPLSQRLLGIWHVLLAPQLGYARPVLAACLLAGAWQAWRHRSAMWWLVGLGLVASTLAVILPGRDFNHYYILMLPFIALGAAQTLQHVQWRGQWGQWGQWGVGLAFMVCIVTGCWRDYLNQTPVQLAYNRVGSFWSVRDAAVGRELLAGGLTNERIFVDGSHGGVFFYSENRPAISHFVYFQRLDRQIPPGETVEALAANGDLQFFVMLEVYGGAGEHDPIYGWIRAHATRLEVSPMLEQLRVELWHRTPSAAQSPDPTPTPDAVPEELPGAVDAPGTP